MKVFTIIAFLLLFFTVLQAEEDPILRIMVREADIVAHVKVLRLEEPLHIEPGLDEWESLCEILTPIKGKFVKGDQIRVRFLQSNTRMQVDALRMHNTEEYIVFLKGKAPTNLIFHPEKKEPAFNLLDRWLGITDYTSLLVHYMTIYVGS